MNKFLEKFWFPAAALLLIAFLLGLVLFVQKQPLKHALEVKQRASPVSQELSLYIDGAVDRPGWYTLNREESLEKALRSAGIRAGEADTAKIKLHVPRLEDEKMSRGQGEQAAPTKININTASAKALETLPGIGPVLAGRVIQYRNDKGPFKSVEELTSVRGIGPAILDKIRDLITVE